MKARVRPPIVPKILFYAIEPGSEQEQALAQLCRRQGILWEDHILLDNFLDIRLCHVVESIRVHCL